MVLLPYTLILIIKLNLFHSESPIFDEAIDQQIRLFNAYQNSFKNRVTLQFKAPGCNWMPKTKKMNMYDIKLHYTLDMIVYNIIYFMDEYLTRKYYFGLM